MRVLLLLLLAPLMGYPQFVGNLTYKSKEVHSITDIKYLVPSSDGIGFIEMDSTNWKIDTINYSVPFEIKITAFKIAIDGYGTYNVSAWKDKSHEGTKIDYWELSNGTNICKIESLMYWNYPTVNHKSKIIFFQLE